MDVTVDVGGNITSLLEKLAVQLGVTVDKVYPIFVKQQVLEGWVTLGVIAALSIVCIATISIGLYIVLKKGKEIGVPLVVGGGVVLLITFLIGVCEGGTAITKINNPEYYAIKAIADTIH